MFDHFDFLAPIYDRVIKAKPPQRLAELADFSPSNRVLDVGGGTGRISQFISDQVDQVIIADLSFKMLGKSQLKNGLLPVNSHSEFLPFPDATFDRIIMVDTLHHVCDQNKTAQELWRVTKPGGKIVIEEPDIHTWAAKLVALAEKLALMRSHFLSTKEIQDLFTGLPAKTVLYHESHFAWVVIEKE